MWLAFISNSDVHHVNYIILEMNVHVYIVYQQLSMIYMADHKYDELSMTFLLSPWLQSPIKACHTYHHHDFCDRGECATESKYVPKYTTRPGMKQVKWERYCSWGMRCRCWIRSRIKIILSWLTTQIKLSCSE